MLHKEERVRFWAYRVKRTRFKKRLVVQNSTVTEAFSGRYQTYHIVRTWYSTVTREFKTEIEEVRNFDQDLAEGWAVYDWVNKTTHVPQFATNEAPS